MYVCYPNNGIHGRKCITYNMYKEGNRSLDERKEMYILTYHWKRYMDVCVFIDWNLETTIC